GVDAATIRGGGISEQYDKNDRNILASSSSSSSAASSKNKNAVQRELRTVQNYCGKDWGTANSECKRPCPDGNKDVCAWGEECFADLTSCPSMTIEVSFSTAGETYETTTTNYQSITSSIVDDTDTDTLIYPGKAKTPPHCSPSTTDIINVGYYQSWAKYRQADCYPLHAADINVKAHGYTHLIYSFAGISLFGKLEPYNGILDEVNLYIEFNNLKKNPDNLGLKTLIAVGGWTFDQKRFTLVASTDTYRKLFAQSVVDFCIKYQFDGIDFDWEYPVTRDGTPEDFVNYPLLIQEVRHQFTIAKETKGVDLLLTMAVPVNPSKISDGYDLKSLSPNVDWYNLMAYDIHGHWDDVTGSHTDLGYIQTAVELMMDKGVTGDKMALGLASYGRSMRLTNHVSEGCSSLGCPINGAGVEGCNGEMGFSPLFDLKQKYVDTGMYDSLLMNEKTGSMEMIIEDGNVFVTFDLEQSFQKKREYYLSKCFRGQMWWAIDMLQNPPFGQFGSLATPISSPAISEPVSANAPGVDNNDAYCKGESGLIAIDNCSGFVHCNQGQMTGSVTKCETGLVFDQNLGLCNWPSATNLCGFEFCEDDYTGHMPFEDCTKFYFCRDGKISGDIETCAAGTLFDTVLGICNWKSEVICVERTPPPTPPPIPAPAISIIPATTYGAISSSTPPPTYGSIASAYSGSRGEEDSGSTKLRFGPSDDAYVQEEKPYENFNDNYIVADQNLRFDGLLRFNIQGVEDRVINYAKLRLFVVNPSDAGGKFFQCRDDWHEDVVTWDRAPSIISGSPVAVINHALLQDQWVEVDVTSLVTQNGPVALRFVSDSADNVMFSSKENTNRNAPELIVDVESTAEAFTFSDKVNTHKIGPTDDATVIKGGPNKNFGREPELKIDADPGEKKSYLRFDFSKVNIASIQKATLRLFALKSAPFGGSFMKITNNDWSEDSINWSNAPSVDGAFLGTLPEIVESNWYELDITSAISESGPLSICIVGNHDVIAMYSSKDGLHSPEITLDLQEGVPEDGETKEMIPSDDATITLSKPYSNFGTSVKLVVDSRNGMNNFLLRFDASDVPQGQVKSAKLRLYAQNSATAYGGTFVQTTNTQWDERSVTWSNAPLGDGVVLGSIPEAEAGTWYEIDATNAVMGGAPVSFRVSSPHSSTAMYASRESAFKPRLIVQYKPKDPLPDGFDVYHPTDDASILKDKSATNFGFDGQLRVDGEAGVFNSLLRFDLTGVEKGTVKEASLRLYAVDGSRSGGTLITTKQTFWNQYTVNWDNAPSPDGIVIETLGEVIPYNWYTVDLSKILGALGGEALSIRITASSGNRVAYSSSEDPFGNAPELLIKVDNMFSDMQ
ncbi:hypothetical protein ACHAWT_009188, partial [Skeletonema menzelii]